jgi:A/G-specific adenine glycosylase
MSKKNFLNKKKEFNKILLSWAKKNKRSFFWREDRNAYNVFIAEFLLKRTTSKAAHRVFKKFLHNYPNLAILAATDIMEFEKVLEPIGLNRQRARGIKRAAEFLVERCGGKFPSSFKELLGVPHIGPYTAACILSFGMNVPSPAIDSNGQRILSRFFRDELGDQSSMKKVLEFSWTLLPKKEHVLFNYGLIDFGALMCTYRGCSKEICPFHTECDTYKTFNSKNLKKTL